MEQDFHISFKSSLEFTTGETYDNKSKSDLCRIFEGLNPEQLNEVLNNIALLMNRDRIQILNYY